MDSPQKAGRATYLNERSVNSSDDPGHLVVAIENDHPDLQLMHRVKKGRETGAARCFRDRVDGSQ